MAEKAEKPQYIRPTEEEVRERTTKASTFQTLYANQVRLAPSFYDIRVFFGQSSVTPKNEQTFEDHLAVVLSPECAKAFLNNLLLSVQKYEEVFGKIRDLPSPEPTPTNTHTSKRKR